VDKSSRFKKKIRFVGQKMKLATWYQKMWYHPKAWKEVWQKYSNSVWSY